MFCSKCGKEITQAGSFCPSCGAQIANSEASKAQPQSVNLTVSRPLLTGIGAIALIVFLLQRMMSIPVVNLLLGLVGLDDGWFSFYDLANTMHSLYRMDGDSELIPAVIITWFIFIFSVVCIILLVVYLFGMGKKWSKAQRVGKVAFLLTAIFSIIVFISALALNSFVSNQLGEIGQMASTFFDLRAIQFRWTFYVMAVVAVTGWVLGFEKEADGVLAYDANIGNINEIDSTHRQTSDTSRNNIWLQENKKYICLLVAFVIVEALTFIIAPYIISNLGFPLISVPFFFIEFVLRGFLFTGIFIYLLKTEGLLKTIMFLAISLFVSSIVAIAMVSGRWILFHFSEFYSWISFFGNSIIILIAYIVIGLISKIKMPKLVNCIVIGALFAGIPHLIINLTVSSLPFPALQNGWHLFFPALFISPLFGALAGVTVYVLRHKLKIDSV